MWQKNKNVERERIYKKINDEFKTWNKDIFYYRLHNLIIKDNIFSKLSYTLMNRGQISSFGSYTNLLKNFFIIPIMVFWSVFLIKIERSYYKIKYPNTCTLQDVKNKNFDYLFVLNTRYHTITALPVLEKLDGKANSLVVTFKGVYTKYKDDFDKLKSTQVIFFEYELKDLPLTKYLRIIKESKNNFRLLESQNLDSDLKQLIEIDRNFIKFHLKTELIQYFFFENVFNAFDLKGAVSIVFTTAFELCKARGIPTFVLQHGIGGKGHGHPYVCDYWFTLDDVSTEQLDEWLDNTVEVLSVGSPRFEYLKSIASSKRDISNFNKKIGSAEYKRNVTYISVGTKEFENKELFLALKKLREKLPEDVNFIIKLHPRGGYNTKKEIKRIFSTKELRGTVFIKKEMDFYDILANSDIVVTTLSTGVLESIAMDIPTLQVNFTGEPYPKEYDLSSFGWKEPINDPDVMVDEVLPMLSDKKRYEEVIKKQSWLKNRMFKNFGSCGKVIAETIVNICNERDKQGKGYDKIGV
jgi:hypothetical protein